MAGTMGKELRRERCQVLRNIVKVSDTNRQHYTTGLNCLAIVEPHSEPARHPIGTHHELVFQLRYHSIAEGKAIGNKSFESNRYTSVGILDASLCTKLPQSKA